MISHKKKLVQFCDISQKLKTAISHYLRTFFSIPIRYSCACHEGSKGLEFFLKYNRKGNGLSEKKKKKTDLLVYVISPEPGVCPFIWVSRQQGWPFGPRLFNELDDDERLADGPSIVDQNRDFLVNWVGFQQELALIYQIFFLVSIFNTLF